MIGQVRCDAIEAVCDRRARGASGGEVRPEHKVVDEELRAATEKVCQRGAARVGFEAVSLIEGHPGQVLPLARQLVAAMCNFLLCLEQLQPSVQPLLPCSRLMCGHCLNLLSFDSRCDPVFDCHALYLARGVEGVGVTSVAGFAWTPQSDSSLHKRRLDVIEATAMDQKTQGHQRERSAV